nr:immune deficiency [Macrobrachium rosenbergii]
MNNLRTDSLSLGTSYPKDPLRPHSPPPPQDSKSSFQRPGVRQAPTTGQGPRVINITGSSGVHIGAVFNNVAVKPKPKCDPKDMPLQRDVDALKLCCREIEERDKFLVGEHLGQAWRSLGRAMNFSSGQLENVDADFTRNADKTVELLNLWHDRESQRATVARLVALILEVKAYHVLKYLKPRYS